ncbi:DNA-binding response regulator [Tenuifilaceae bacterium CYCD]|nr:DNA-binding response regulator [Tenuifilaceae bacterium CYCD]
MRVLIVEDEIAAARRLSKMLLELEPDAQILAVTDSVSSTVEWLLSNDEPDLILLDIHLADGVSFKIFNRVKVKCPIIFTTAYDQYAIQAFKLNSIDYLLKPINTEDLKFSVDKFKERRNVASNLDFEKLLLEIRKPQQCYQQRFVVQFADKLKAIEADSVAYFMAMDKSVFLISSDNHRYAIDYTMEKLESVLDPKRFFRVNRKFIVSFAAIKNMYFYSKSRVKIELSPAVDSEVIVSSERSSDFKEWLNQ